MEKGKQLSTPTTSEPVSTCQEGQDKAEEVSFEKTYLVDPSWATTWLGKSTAAPGTCTPLTAWPWAGGGPYTDYIPYNMQNTGLTNTAWPCANSQFSSWGMPYVPHIFPIESDSMANAGVWPYPSVSNTGYNMVSLGALPYGDYSMPLGDHPTPAIKEKI